MSVRIATHELVGLLTDLVLTASDPADGGPTAAVLLHTARGYAGSEPGLTDLLVGTSTNRVTAGHSHVQCTGQIEPMLWAVSEARSILAVLKPLGKDKDHSVEITVEDGKVAVAEDPDLFGERLKVTFAPMDADEFPPMWSILTDIRMMPAAEYDADGAEKPRIGPGPRTDFTASYLAPFLKIAARRGKIVEVFRYHQSCPVHIQIGSAYRGVVMPSTSWQTEDRSAGAAPSGDVYPLAVP